MPPRRMVLTQWRKIAAALLPCVFAAGVLHAQGIATSNGCALPAPLSGYKFVLEKQSSGYAWERVEQRFTNVGDHAALVHVRAVSLDRGDLDVLSASAGRDLSGMIPLSDGAGDVVAVGRQVRGLRVGDRVVSTYFRNWTDAWASAEQLRDARGASVAGVFADQVSLEDTSLIEIQRGMSFEDAAALSTAALTAWNMLMGERRLQRGDVVLLQGAGGVSTFALQFAHAAGATAIVTSSSDEKLARARTLGASETINYKGTFRPRHDGRAAEERAAGE